MEEGKGDEAAAASPEQVSPDQQQHIEGEDGEEYVIESKE